MSYEILAQKEEFKAYEDNIIKHLRGYVNVFCNRNPIDPIFLKGKIEGIKEALMLNIEAIKDDVVRKKLKEALKRKIIGLEREAFMTEEEGE